MRFMTTLEFPCFADFFIGILKTRQESGFPYPAVEETVNSMEQKDSSLMLN
jgi:hypothetical protein